MERDVEQLQVHTAGRLLRPQPAAQCFSLTRPWPVDELLLTRLLRRFPSPCGLPAPAELTATTQPVAFASRVAESRFGVPSSVSLSWWMRRPGWGKADSPAWCGTARLFSASSHRPGRLRGQQDLVLGRCFPIFKRWSRQSWTLFSPVRWCRRNRPFPEQDEADECLLRRLKSLERRVKPAADQTRTVGESTNFGSQLRSSRIYSTAC